MLLVAIVSEIFGHQICSLLAGHGSADEEASGSCLGSFH